MLDFNCVDNTGDEVDGELTVVIGEAREVPGEIEKALPY